MEHLIGGAVAVVVAAVLAWFSPDVLARVPEPDDADDDKPAYAELAATRNLRPWLVGVSAVVVALLAWQLEIRSLIVVWTFLVPLGALLAYVDWRTRLLPKRLVIPSWFVVAALVGVTALLERDVRVLVHALVAGVIVFALFWISWFVFPRGIGYGDVRLAGVLALGLGPLGTEATLIGLYSGFVLGAIGGIVLSRLKLVDPKAFAFGPYLVVGAVLGAGWGPGLF